MLYYKLFYRRIDSQHVQNQSQFRFIGSEIKDYYDILSASLGRVNDKLIFSMDLAGDPNKNEKSEIPYIWLLYYNTS